MDKFLAGMIAGIVLERFHIIGTKPSVEALLHTDCIKPEVLMTDLFFLAVAAGAFVFFAWAVRALKS